MRTTRHYPLARYLVERGGATEAEADAIAAEVERTMEEAIAYAESCPEPSLDEFLNDVRAL